MVWCRAAESGRILFYYSLPAHCNIHYKQMHCFGCQNPFATKDWNKCLVYTCKSMLLFMLLNLNESK
jgi:hypothetical protein